MVYNESLKMCDVIACEPSLLQVMTRFGMPLGVGERKVGEVCAENRVDVNTFLAVANFNRCKEEVVDYYVDKVSVTALVEYLKQAHTYFLDLQLPSIRRQLLEAIDCSKSDDVAYMILKFYDEYVGEVRRHMLHENRKVFTYVESLMQGKRTAGFQIDLYAKSHTSIDRKLQELKNIIIKYYTPTGHYDKLNNVLFSIFMCESDLRAHCELEDCVFVPAVRKLEELAEDEHPEAGADEGASEGLSEREKEIVRCVVKGLTNKEIAAKLFISVNTVLTHRKNISRKLNIHSVSGLTIYAIVNSLVNLEDVRMQ